MARPVTAKFGKFIVSLSDGGTPETFVAPCGFTSKSLTLSKNLSEVSIPDCDNPDDPIWLGRDVQSNTAAISGEGVLAAEAVEAWNAAYESTDSINCEIEIQFSTGTLRYVGYFHLETLTLGAEQGGRVTINVSMQSDGEVERTWTPA
ncbi:MAG: phage tail tube protein [Parvibaculaceae bacterium]